MQSWGKILTKTGCEILAQFLLSRIKHKFKVGFKPRKIIILKL